MRTCIHFEHVVIYYTRVVRKVSRLGRYLALEKINSNNSFPFITLIEIIPHLVRCKFHNNSFIYTNATKFMLSQNFPNNPRISYLNPNN